MQILSEGDKLIQFDLQFFVAALHRTHLLILTVNIVRLMKLIGTFVSAEVQSNQLEEQNVIVFRVNTAE